MKDLILVRRFILCFVLSEHDQVEMTHPLNGLTIQRCSRCGHVEAWWLS